MLFQLPFLCKNATLKIQNEEKGTLIALNNAGLIRAKDSVKLFLNFLFAPSMIYLRRSKLQAAHALDYFYRCLYCS